MEQWRILASFGRLSRSEMSTQTALGRLAARAKREAYRLSKRDRRLEEPAVIELYLGYRSSCKLFVQGRVLEHENVRVTDSDTRWMNFLNALRRFESDEVAGAEVIVSYRGYEIKCTTDSEGYFTIHHDVDDTADAEPWEGVRAKIVSLPGGQPLDGREFTGSVADLTRDSKLAIITDIDDTILQTGVTSLFKLRALYRTLADNAYTRVPFTGAAELFAALSSGPVVTEEANPIFYLSNSPWNLYGLLKEFLDIKAFPKGPIFLRDVGLTYEGSPKTGTHKSETIRRMLADFPTVTFVLIGDSGEADADIYHAAAEEFPERIKAVVIRNVKDNSNAARIKALFAGVLPTRNFIIVHESAEAAERLAAIGLLNEEQVAAVKAAQ